MANIFVRRGPLWIRYRTLFEIRRGRGSQFEFQSPLPIRIIHNRDGAGDASGDSTVSGALDAFGDFAGSAIGDATASGALDAFGDFAGAASGDATASGALDAFGDFAGAATGDAIAAAEGDYTVAADVLTVPFYRSIERGTKRTLGRGPQFAIEVPLTLRAPGDNFQDGAGSAIGDATASGALDAFGDFSGSAIGDATASGTLDAFADFAGSAIGDATASGALDAFGDFAGSAIGDATASGALDALGDFAGAATGDATADGAIQATYDYPLSATYHLLTQQGARRKQREIIERSRPTPITAFVAAADGDGAGFADGDSTASGALDAFGDFAGAASGDATASGGLDALADFAGSAIGDATVSGGFDAFADMAGSAVGDATCTAEGTSDNNQDCAGSAVGDSTCEGFIEDATPVVVTPPVADAGGTGGQVFRGVWTDRLRKPKRKKRLDDLDEMIAELRSRIVEVAPEEDDYYGRQLRVSSALANRPDPSLREVENQIALLRAAINEIDDEEAILLLAA
jgi:hypothetical protein